MRKLKSLLLLASALLLCFNAYAKKLDGIDYTMIQRLLSDADLADATLQQDLGEIAVGSESGNVYVSDGAEFTIVNEVIPDLTVTDNLSVANTMFATDGYLSLDGYLTVSGTIMTDMLRQNDTWHAYGGFQDLTESLSIDADTWTHVTNGANDMWTGLEADGLDLISDEMVIINKGDYVGSMSVTFEGGNQKDYLFRIYNVTQASVSGYHIGASGNGSSNYVNVTVPIYIEAEAGDHFKFEVYQDSGSDAVFKNSIFYLSYLHD